MKAKVLRIALLLVVLNSAQAQWQPEQQHQQAENLLKSYNPAAANMSQKIELLEQVDSMGLPPSSANVRDVRRLLSSELSSDEKVPLVRILAGMHTYDDRSGQNSIIAAEVRRMAQLSDRAVARAATLSYSHIGYNADLTEVLAQGRSKNLVSVDEYFGELAHALPDAPAPVQGELGILLAKGDNEFAAKILAETVGHREIDAMLHPDARKSVLSLLMRHQPVMPSVDGEFGDADAIFYATWLQGVATLTAATGGKSYSQVVMAHLNDPTTDPRKLIAFLGSKNGKHMMEAIGKQQTSASAARAIAFAKRFPDHPSMKPMADEIARTADGLGW